MPNNRPRSPLAERSARMNSLRLLSRREFVRCLACAGRAGVGLVVSGLVGGCRGATEPAHTLATPPPSPPDTPTPPSPTSPHTDPHVHFTDITHQAGLDFLQSDASCGMRYFVEQVASGAAVFDANADGHLDIYFPQPHPLGVCRRRYPHPLKHRLYLGDGKGHFTLSENAFGGVETEYGIAAAVGDYNNDGHADLYVCCYGKNKLFRNRGDGSFEDMTEKAGVAVGGMSTGALWFDYDGDGWL